MRVQDAELASARVDCAALAIAGPVSGGRASLTNAEGWEFDERALEQAFPCLQRVRVLNDFEAIGHGIPLMRDEQVRLCAAAKHAGASEGGAQVPRALAGPTPAAIAAATGASADSSSNSAAQRQAKEDAASQRQRQRQLEQGVAALLAELRSESSFLRGRVAALEQIASRAR